MRRDKEFLTAFWVVFPAIFLFQIYTVILGFLFGFDSHGHSKEFNLLHDTGTVIWLLAISMVSTIILKKRGENIVSLFNINLGIFKRSLPTLFKYSLVSVAGVLILSLLRSETELGFEQREDFGILMSIVLTVLMAPICEEIIFRGFLQTSMIKTFSRELERVLINAIFFSAAHVFFIDLIMSRQVPIYIFILGSLLALLYEKYQSILPCILLHIFNNLLVVIIDLYKYSNY